MPSDVQGPSARAAEAAPLWDLLDAHRLDDAATAAIFFEAFRNPAMAGALRDRRCGQPLWVAVADRFIRWKGRCNGPQSDSLLMQFIHRLGPAAAEDAVDYAAALARPWAGMLARPDPASSSTARAMVLDSLGFICNFLAPRLPPPAGLRSMLESTPRLVDGLAFLRVAQSDIVLQDRHSAEIPFCAGALATWKHLWEGLPDTTSLQDRALALPCGRIARSLLAHYQGTPRIAETCALARSAWLQVLSDAGATQSVLEAAHVSKDQADPGLFDLAGVAHRLGACRAAQRPRRVC